MARGHAIERAPRAVASGLGLDSYKPLGGYVPDEKTAVRIAVAVWEPIYGVEAIAEQRPYHARLENGVWIVEGSLPKPMPGGVAVAEIAQDDGRICRVRHGR
jgi:hypothetical protein